MLPNGQGTVRIIAGRQLQSLRPFFPLKPLKLRKRQLAGVHVQRPEFGATPKRRDRFAGVEKTVGVEGAFDGMELFKLLGRELDTHLVQLLDPHAMLPGDGAAGLDANLENLPAERFRPFQLTGGIGVIEDERMQVAVARMEDVGHGQSEL